MADQEIKADDREDQDDASGNMLTATPDEDRDLKMKQGVSSDEGKDDDTEGHVNKP